MKNFDLNKADIKNESLQGKYDTFNGFRPLKIRAKMVSSVIVLIFVKFGINNKVNMGFHHMSR